MSFIGSYFVSNPLPEAVGAGRQPRTPPDGVTAALSVLEYETFGVREE